MKPEIHPEVNHSIIGFNPHCNGPNHLDLPFRRELSESNCPRNLYQVFAGAKRLWIGECAAEEVEIFWFREFGQAEFMDLLDRAREVRVDFEAVEIADDQQGWVLEVFAVLEELLVGGCEVFMFAFIFPAEVVAKPDVGPAAAGGGRARLQPSWFSVVTTRLGGSLALPFVVDCGFANAALECVPRACGVGGGRFGLAEEVAEIEKVLLASTVLGELSGLPLSNEFVWGHGGLMTLEIEVIVKVRGTNPPLAPP